ncbi:unnamed protein product [Protopolystoma xenopodis]|uniref:Uncharacterized protein n=1 Tax=Protopolystoma xenopodis TaxID=117903 RepID=A0A3S5ARL4_9PLAT|nr:unnamed protein product [Protopolystoma xenopodis]
MRISRKECSSEVILSDCFFGPFGGQALPPDEHSCAAGIDSIPGGLPSKLLGSSDLAQIGRVALSTYGPTVGFIRTPGHHRATCVALNNSAVLGLFFAPPAGLATNFGQFDSLVAASAKATQLVSGFETSILQSASRNLVELVSATPMGYRQQDVLRLQTAFYTLSAIGTPQLNMDNSWLPLTFVGQDCDVAEPIRYRHMKLT